MFSGRLRAALSFLLRTSVCLPLSPTRQSTAARFDLAGPRVDVRVTRDGKTLPIAAVPNLQAGDKHLAHPDLPRTQSVHYLLVVVFLRGTTNPPPDNWFIKIETWNKKVREEGVDHHRSRRGPAGHPLPRPGDRRRLRHPPLRRAGTSRNLRSRLRRTSPRPASSRRASRSTSPPCSQVPPGDAKALHDHSTFLARTLNLKPNQDCFNRPVDMQYTCLTQTGTQTLLDDGHGQTVVSMLSSSDTSAFINAACYTALGGGGLYSAYVGAIVDLVRLMGNLHTAQYQYIPAIAFPQAEQLNLRLNTPPSFHNPKSVIVIGLPAIQNAVPPPLRAADPKHITCLLKPSVVLPVEGAPLVFSTGFAHDLVLHVNGGDPRPDIPLTPDAFKGGLVLAPATRAQGPALAFDDAAPERQH